MRKLLVTGGAGFIGSHLAARLLADGGAVTILDDLSSGTALAVPKGAKLVVGSVCDATVVEPLVRDADACVHLAAVASVEASRLHLTASHRTNVTGFVTILDAVRRRAAPMALVYASSAAVYGASQDLPLTEKALADPISAYAVDKYACELHAAAAARAYGVGSVGLRFFNVFGPGQDPSSPYSGVISKFLARAQAGEDLTIFGDGGQTRDFVSVRDIVNALVLAAVGPSSIAAVYNVCTGQECSIEQLAQTIVSLSGGRSVIGHAEGLPGEVRRSCGDAAAFARDYGFAPSVTLQQGLRDLLENGESVVSR